MFKKILISFFLLFLSFQFVLGDEVFNPIIKNIEINNQEGDDYVMSITPESDKSLIKSISANIANSEEKSLSVDLKNNENSWVGNFSVPSVSSEEELWSVKKITITDEGSRVKEYLESEINKTFAVNNSQLSEEDECIKKSGVWENNTCNCPSGDTSCFTIAAVTVKKEVCNFNYSEWSECLIDGIKTRELKESLSNCSNEPILQEECVYKVVPCSFVYSEWSECSIDGFQERSVTSKNPANCNSGEEILKQSCKYVEPVKEIIEEVVVTKDDFEIEAVQKDVEGNILSVECLKADLNNKADCDVYKFQLKVVPECLYFGFNTYDQCKNYFLTNYGKPLKCENLSEESCEELISKVILSSLNKMITEKEKSLLSELSGKKVNIIKEQEKILISEQNTEKEINFNNLPIVIEENKNVSAIFISVELNSSQQGLSPVALALSSNENNLPDDVISRVGSDFKVEDLSGVDKAIINEKPLEQPKNISSVGNSLLVKSVETIKKSETESSLKVQGKALPNQVITLFIYSSMPIVITVKADNDGNWIYSLDKSMVDGTHEVYAVLHNDEGKIIESSVPKIFFIEEAQAASIEDFVVSGNITQANDETKNMMMLYLLGGFSAILVLITLFLIIKEKFSN